MDFSLLFFGSDANSAIENKYQLFVESVKHLDGHFRAVWIPERHFHPFGGLYPNPSVLAAALATVTKHIRLRAGSVVLPLHDPIRVAEEWAVVDNLSNGRVDLAFAQGWNARDFVFAPESYENRLDIFKSSIATVKKLWEGASISRQDGEGTEVSVQIFPRPKQPNINIWITCSGALERFIQAGETGANVLTALLFQTAQQLATKISAYRQARERNGFDPNSGVVTLMLHTFVGPTQDYVREHVKEPFTKYLAESISLWRQEHPGIDAWSDRDQNKALSFAFERYYRTSALLGTASSCVQLVEEFRAAGVNEIASLIDFGVQPSIVLENLENLRLLQATFNKRVAPIVSSTDHTHGIDARAGATLN